MTRQHFFWRKLRLYALVLGVALLASYTASGEANTATPAATTDPNASPTPVQAETAETSSPNEPAAVLRYFVNGIIDNTQWPSLPNTEISLCLAGNPALQQSLQTTPLVNRHGTVQLQAIASDTTANRLHNCSVLFIGAAIPETIATNWVLSLIGKPVVTIRENPELCRDGALICLYTAKSHTPTFDVNLDAVSRSGVLLNPMVLTLSNTMPSDLLSPSALQ